MRCLFHSTKLSKRFSLRMSDDPLLKDKAMPPSFQSNLAGVVSDLRTNALTELGKDALLISQEEMEAQQAQVMRASEVLGDIAAMIAKSEQGKSARTASDSLKEQCVAQQRVLNTLKEQLATQQTYAHKLAEKKKDLEVALETVQRRLKNATQKAHDLEVQNKELRIKNTQLSLDTKVQNTASFGHSPKWNTGEGSMLEAGAHSESVKSSSPQRLISTLPLLPLEQPESHMPTMPSDQLRRNTGELISALQDHVAGLCAAAFWTWNFSHIQHLICSTCGVDAVHFVLRNHATGGLVSSSDASVSGNLGSIGSLFRSIPVDAEISLAACTAEAGSSMTISDLSADMRRHPLFDITPWSDAKTCILSVPISHAMEGVCGDKKQVVIGVLQVASRGRHGFDKKTEEDIKALAAFCAEPLAVRLRNEHKILDFSVKTKSAAETIAATIAGSYDIAIIAPVLEQHIRQTITCDMATVMWVDRTNPPVLNRVSDGDVISSPLLGLAARCIDTGEEINVSDLRSLPGSAGDYRTISDQLPNVASLLLIPIFGANQQPVALLQLLGTRVGAFNAFEAHIIQSIRAIAALGLGSAIHNGAASFSRRDHLQGMLRKDGADVPIHRVCHQLEAQISAALCGKFADAVFYAVDDMQNEIRMIPYTDSVQSSGPKNCAIGTGLCGDTASSGKVSRVRKTSEDRRFNLFMDLVSPAFSNSASLWVPLRNLDGRVMGVAGVFATSYDAFESSDSTILRLCHEIGPYFSDLVYLNALESERRRWREVAQRILPVFESQDFTTCVETVKAAFVTLFHLKRCQQWVFDPHSAMLTYNPGRGGGRDVSVSVNDPEHLCRCARSGKMHIAPLASFQDHLAKKREDLRGLPESAQNAHMVVPLMDSSNRPIIVIQADRNSSFSDAESEMMLEMSKIGALGLEHAKTLESESVPGAKKIEEALILSLTVEDAMREVMAAGRKLCQCTNAIVFWPSPDGNSMCQYYLDGSQVKMKTFVSTCGIAAECLAERKPMLLHNSRIHLKFHASMDGLHDLERAEKSDMHAPPVPAEPIQAIYYPVELKNTNQPIAVICVREKKRGMAFNRIDMISLGVLARQTALTLQNVERYEGLLEVARTREMRHTQMASLNSIRTMGMDAFNNALSQFSVNEVVKQMGEVMCEIIGVEACKLYVVEEGGKILRLLGNSQLQDKLIDVEKAQGSDISCRVLRENKTVLFDLDTLKSEEDHFVRFEVDGLEMRNSLTVPLRAEFGHVFGVLQLINTREGSFSGSDELVVHMAAGSFKTILHTCLLSDIRFDIGLSSIEIKPSEIAAQVLEKALLLVAADAGQVLVLVEGKTQLKRLAEITSSGDRIGAFSSASGRFTASRTTSSGNLAEGHAATKGLAGLVVQTKTIINVAQLNEEMRFDSTIDMRYDYEGTHSFICVPMLTSTGECMGVIQLVKVGVGQFTERNVQLLHIMAKQAGTIMWNHERHERSMSTSLQRIVQLTESVMWCLEVQPNVDLIVSRIAESVINIVPCENVVLLFSSLKGRGGGYFWTKIATKPEDIWPFKKRPNRTAFSGRKAHTDVKIPLGNCIIAEVVQSRKTVEIVRPDLRFTPEYQSISVTEVCLCSCMACLRTCMRACVCSFTECAG